MISFGRYLRYRFGQTIVRTVAISLIATVLTLYTIAHEIATSIEYRETGLYMLAVVLGIITVLIPILETAGFKNRRNLDTLYSFSIGRKGLAAVHFLSGWIQILSIYTFTFAVSFLYLQLRTNYFALQYMIPYYFLSLCIGLVMYSIFLFLFGEANTVADGVLFCFLGIFALYCVLGGFQTFILDVAAPYLQLTNTVFEDYISWGIIYAPINALTVVFQELIHVNQLYLTFPAWYLHGGWFYFAIWGLLGIGALIGYFVRFARKGAERAGDISDSWFGYKTMIPIYGYTLLPFSSAVFIFAMMVIGYFIYRRSFRLKKSDWIVLSVGFVLMLLGGPL